MGEGGSLALEDALVLAETLAAGEDIESALTRRFPLLQPGPSLG
jgi:2-polyprenyl-6-methoxyphenol hydroxylase-like FAD-dependent oxidoreductase